MSNIFHYSSLIIAVFGIGILTHIAQILLKPVKIYQLEHGEYDFMADETSLQSRLDLAHAYHEMGQSDMAIRILKELTNSSDLNIRQKAIQALEKIRH